MTLAEFLDARLDEDEAEAREAADSDSGQWFMGDKWNVHRVEQDAWMDEGQLVCWGNVKPQSEHIARHDPARVLREVAAKRAVLVLHNPMGEPRDYDYHDPPCAACDSHESWPCSTLRALAAVYSDHPDYDPAWKA